MFWYLSFFCPAINMNVLVNDFGINLLYYFSTSIP